MNDSRPATNQGELRAIRDSQGRIVAEVNLASADVTTRRRGELVTFNAITGLVTFPPVERLVRSPPEEFAKPAGKQGGGGAGDITWVTINGAHIPIGADRKAVGGAGGALTPSGAGTAGTVHSSRLYGPVPMRPATEAERKALKVPPAYTDVHVPTEEGAPLLYKAKTPTGDDKQVPSPHAKAAADVAKFQRVQALHRALPALREKWATEIASGGANAHQALALRLIAQTGFRNGGEDAATAIREKNPETGKRETVGSAPTFGASTLRTEHAQAEGDRVSFDFPGKGGKRQQHTVTDPVLAVHVAARKAGGHDTLFDTTAPKTLAYLQRSSGEQFKVHDLRTRHATATAVLAMKRIDAAGKTPRTAAELEARIREVSRVAASRIGDTEKVARESYVNPEVFLRWQSGLK
jgi:DNA topoisomerase I